MGSEMCIRDSRRAEAARIAAADAAGAAARAHLAIGASAAACAPSVLALYRPLDAAADGAQAAGSEAERMRSANRTDAARRLASLPASLLAVSPAGSGACRTASGTVGAHCWTVCMDASHLPCDVTDAVCYDTVSQRDVDGFKMCPSSPMATSCKLRCHQPPPPPSPSPSPSLGPSGDGGSGAQPAPFCVGPGVSMYMEGFASSLLGARGARSAGGRAQCVTLFVNGWVLDSRAKFGLGCVCCALLGIAVEALAVLRTRLGEAADPRAPDDGGQLLLPARARARRAAVLACHALQLTVAYLLMLGAMVYNVELFASIVLGLTVGHALFSEARRFESVDPCCAQPSGARGAGDGGANGGDGSAAGRLRVWASCCFPLGALPMSGPLASPETDMAVALRRTLIPAGHADSGAPAGAPASSALGPGTASSASDGPSASAPAVLALNVRGMVCTACSKRVGGALDAALASAGHGAAVRVLVDLEAERAELHGDKSAVAALRTADLVAAVCAHGYECSLATHGYECSLATHGAERAGGGGGGL